MKKYFIIAVCLFIVGCGGGGGGGGSSDSDSTAPSPVPQFSGAFDYTYPGSGYGIALIDTPQTDAGDLVLTLNLSLDSAVKDVYAIFTNVSNNNITDYPKVADQMEATPRQRMEETEASSEELLEWAVGNGIGLNGKPHITLFNSNPAAYAEIIMNRSAYEMADPPPAEPSRDVVGTTKTFYPDETETTNIPVAATCRKVVAAPHGKTLNVWVADDSWIDTGTDKTLYVTQPMVDALADTFLKAATDNDIYEWVSNVYGEEWGPHAYSNLISDNNEITILLYDIDDDDSINGGTLGFFFAKDNFKKTEFAASSERIMFYLDAVMWANDDEGGSGTWALSDFWPNEMIGTIAHEFQHMINYYQKNILANSSSDIFLNEMASLATEDFVAKKIQSYGPRNVSYLDGTAGPANNIEGRLPRFNQYNYLSVTDWYDGSTGERSVFNSYAMNYSLGAFLLRNYGGPEFFRTLVQNDRPDRTAFDSALSTMGFSDDFSTLLRKWAVAVLLSDRTDAPAGYRYNTGGFSNHPLDAFTYQLGSINMYNYDYPGGSGPNIYTRLPPADTSAGTYKTSNMYYELGVNLTGDSTHEITLRKGQKLTLLVK